MTVHPCPYANQHHLAESCLCGYRTVRARIEVKSKEDARGLSWVCHTCGAEVVRTKVGAHQAWHAELALIDRLVTKWQATLDWLAER